MKTICKVSKKVESRGEFTGNMFLDIKGFSDHTKKDKNV